MARIVERNSKLYYRVKLPPDIQSLIGRREFKRCLDTTSRRKAAELAGQYDSRLQRLFTTLRHGDIDPARASRFANAVLSASLDTDPFAPVDVPEDLPLVLTMSRLSSLYRKEQEATGRWTAKTAKEIGFILDTASAMLGDSPAEDVDRAKLVGWVSSLEAKPPRESIMGEDAKGGLALHTRRKWVSCVASVFKWAHRQGLIQRNPAEGLVPRVPRNTPKTRRPYTEKELARMVDALRLYRFKGREDRWLVPLVAVFSGMRLEEICGMRVQDVVEVGGVKAFHVRSHGSRGVKTECSERLVPLHPELERLGFGNYVAARKRAGGEMLFPELEKGPNGFSHMWGRWYQKLNGRRIAEGPGAVFHSHRHGFVSRLRAAGVAEEDIAELVGHVHPNVTMRVYAEPLRIGLKLAALERLVVPVDFSPLTWP